MGIRIQNMLVAYDSMTYEPVNPEYAGISEEALKKYMENKPMPNDPAYSPEELVFDLTGSSGMYCLPCGVSRDTIEYVETLLNELIC